MNYLAIKIMKYDLCYNMNEPLNIKLSKEISHKRHMEFNLYEISRISKSTEIKSISGCKGFRCQGRRGGGWGGVRRPANGYNVSFWGD